MATVVMLLENNPYPQDTRVRNEAESLTAAGYGVSVLAPRAAGQPARELVNGVQVRRYRLPAAGGSPASYLLEYGVAHAQLTLRALHALAGGARIVHFHGPPDTLFLAGALARLAGRAVVYDLHDSGPELFQAKFGGGSSSLALRMLRAAQRRAIGCASHVIVTNESQRELVRARSGKPARAVSVVRNGPRRTEFSATAPAREGSLEEPRLIYVGALDTQDGVLELPELMCLPGLERARLTIVGDGPVRERLQARFAELGALERIVFTGQVPHAQVPRLIHAADIGIDPAPGSELNHGSTMIKVLEYLGAGRPVVAYDLRETRHSAGPAALYAPCGDRATFAALTQTLAANGVLRLRMGQLARERAAGLMWERSADVLCDAYRRIAPRAV